MASSDRGDNAPDDTLEVGCLSVQLVAARNIKVGGGGMVDMFLGSQLNLYCKISLGESEMASGMGVRTTSGHAWNREQMFFPVKVPLSSVIGTTGRWGAGNQDPGAKAKGAAMSSKGGIYKPARGKGGAGGSGGPSCAGSRARAAEAAEASASREMWDRLTLKARVFCSEDKGGAAATGATSGVRVRGTAAEKAAAAAAAAAAASKGFARESGVGGDGRLVGECSLNLMEVVCGRIPHVGEWVPLDTEGDLRLSLDYDTVEDVPAPGDSVLLLCLANRLDFFPLPIVSDDDPTRPGSPHWLWGSGARSLNGLSAVTAEGFRVERTGDDFFLLSYRTPEGWRCAVEVHRFLVYNDFTAAKRWTLSSLRDHVISTPAASVVRESLRRANQEDSWWTGLKTLAVQLEDGLQWTACRWWNGGIESIRDDIIFALDLKHSDVFSQGCDQPPAEEGEGDGDISSSRMLGGDGAHTVGRGVEGATTGSEGGEDIAREREEAKADRTPPPIGVEGNAATSAGVTVVDAAALRVGDSDKLHRAGDEQASGAPSVPLPQHLCPITRCPMEDPAVAADGYTYERVAIERWFAEHDTSPVTGKPVETKVVFKNWSLVSNPPEDSGR